MVSDEKMADSMRSRVMVEVKDGMLQAFDEEDAISFQRHVFGTNNEYRLSSFFLLFLFLLMICIILGSIITHRWKWRYLQEAGATLLIGIATGLLFLWHSTKLTDVLLKFDPTILFVGLLPPIIFNSGYSMKRRYFFDNFIGILTYAVLGTLISAVVFGLLLYGSSSIGLTVELSFAECITFGSLISATDPVSTLTVFQELRVDSTLFYLVFGESVLNDAVSIVLFQTFSKFVGLSHSATSLAIATVDFALILIGSTFIGVFFGCICSLMFKLLDFRAHPICEVAVYVTFAYLPFLVSEVVEMSGIVSILFTGITMKHYAHNNLSTEAAAICSHLFGVAALLCETAVFLNLGLSVVALRNGYYISLVGTSIVFCLIARACHVYPLSFGLNCKGGKRIAMNQQHMIWFSGLRGAIAYALALSFPGVHRQEIVATTMAIVLFTVFILGGFTMTMLDKLGIKRYTPDEQVRVDAVTRPAHNMKLLRWHALYFMPFLTRDSSSELRHPEAISVATNAKKQHSMAAVAVVLRKESSQEAPGSSVQKQARHDDEAIREQDDIMDEEDIQLELHRSHHH